MQRKKKVSLQSAKNLLQTYLNKASKNLPKSREAVLTLAREELRILFGRT
jgi:hypothetical protein